MPSVNLIPPEIAEAAKFRRFQFAMAGAVAAAVVVVGALYVHAHSGVSGAQNDVTAAQAQQTALQGELSKLQGVQDVYTRVAAQKAMLAQAMSSEIRWSTYLSDLSLRVPDNVWLGKITATESGPTTAVPGQPVTPGIGNITFSGTAFTHDDVATWLDVLSKERGFSDAYFTNSTEARIPGTNKFVTNFTSAANLTDAAESGRYAPKAGS